MYRETDRGLRYYVKEGGTRVVSDRADQSARRRWRWASTLDPSYAFPLPIFGINYLELRVRVARTSSSRCCLPACWRRATSSGSKLGSTPLDASVDFFAIAVPSSDRVYDAGGEAQSRARADLAAVDRAQPRLAGDAVSEGHASSISSASTATCTTAPPAETFDVPSSTVTNGIGGAWEYRRGGYSSAAERRLVRPRDVAAVGTAGGADGRRDDVAADLREVQREPVARFLLQRRFRRSI